MLKTEKDTPEFSDAQEARGKCSQEELGTQTDWTRMSRSLSVTDTTGRSRCTDGSTISNGMHFHV